MIITAIRTIALFVGTINIVLSLWDINPLPWSEDEVYVVLSGVLEAALIIWAWWKNNSFTTAAQAADVFLKDIKVGTIDPLEYLPEMFEGQVKQAKKR